MFFYFSDQQPQNCHIYLIISPEPSSQSCDTLIRGVSGSGLGAVTQVCFIGIYLITFSPECSSKQHLEPYCHHAPMFIPHLPSQARPACVAIYNRAVSALKMHRTSCDHILYSATLQHSCVSQHSTLSCKEALCCNSLGQPFKLTSNNIIVNI